MNMNSQTSDKMIIDDEMQSNINSIYVTSPIKKICSIHNENIIVNILQLNVSNMYDNTLWILLVQLFIEYYFFNTYDYNVQITQINPRDKIDKNELFYDKFTYYDANTSTDSPKMSQYNLNAILNIIYRYYCIFNGTENDNFFKIVNDFIDNLTLQIRECENYNDIKHDYVAQFNDSRNYSISTLVSYLLFSQCNDNIHIIKINNQDSYITHGHVFIVNHLDTKSIEAISIQTSLLLLNDNICNNTSCNISQKLFDFIFAHNPYPLATHIYAYAWPKLSHIIVKHYSFIQIIQTDSIFTFRYKNKTSGNMVESNIPFDLFDFNIVDLSKLLLHNSPYIFTFRKL